VVKLVGLALLIGTMITVGVVFALDTVSAAYGSSSLCAEWLPAVICGLVGAIAVLLRGNDGESISEIWKNFREHWDEINWW
jgi:predicted tellurium resistance membrane protein TerC